MTSLFLCHQGGLKKSLLLPPRLSGMRYAFTYPMPFPILVSPNLPIPYFNLFPKPSPIGQPVTDYKPSPSKNIHVRSHG
jgi:hypothetical protein